MNNEELKTRFDELQKQIALKQEKGEDVSLLIEEETDLLKIAYQKLSEGLNKAEFEKNPKKYSTLLAYLNNIKNLQEKLNKSTDETEKEILKIHSQMENAGLGWLLNNK